MQPTPFTLRTATLCGPPKPPGSNRMAALGALASIGVLMMASQARAAAPPGLATTKISGAPAALTENAAGPHKVEAVLAAENAWTPITGNWSVNGA